MKMDDDIEGRNGQRFHVKNREIYINTPRLSYKLREIPVSRKIPRSELLFDCCLHAHNIPVELCQIILSYYRYAVLTDKTILKAVNSWCPTIEPTLTISYIIDSGRYPKVQEGMLKYLCLMKISNSFEI